MKPLRESLRSQIAENVHAGYKALQDGRWDDYLFHRKRVSWARSMLQDLSKQI